LVAKGLYSEVERQIKEAMTISLITDLGDDFFTTAKERIERLKNRDNMVSTGWQVIDKKLYGGYTKGSLNIYAGGSGSGKSLFLQNQALNWAMAGMNVIYITLELSSGLGQQPLGLDADRHVHQGHLPQLERGLLQD
jgi:predicted ATP-dependent serine protease